MCSPQSETEQQQFAGRKTRQSSSISSTFNDIRDVIEGQRENEDFVENGRDFESDEDFIVDNKKKKKRKVSKKHKMKVSKSETSNDVSSTTPVNDSSLNIQKFEPVLQAASHENTRMITPLALAAPTTVLQVAYEYDSKIPNILSNVDNPDIQLMYTQAPTENALPSSTSQEIGKSKPCQTQKSVPGMVHGTNGPKIESIVGKGTKIKYTKNTCTSPPPSTITTSQQAVKALPSQIKKLIPNQIGKKYGQSQAAKLPGGRGRGRGRGRNVRQAGPIASPGLKHMASGAPSPARLSCMLRPSPPSRLRLMKPRISECSGIMSQFHTPTVSPLSRPRMNAGLSSTRPLQRAILTHEPQPVDPPLVIEPDTDTSQQHDHPVAPITTTTPIPNLVLPPSISITRQPQAYRTDTDNNSTTNITSLARALVKVGDTEGKKCLVLYEITESQIQGLRDLGLMERRI